eukprot:GABV01000851.1.p1 GENE.GABV01000851.1~~GABV01000851.1.p1  ORF type:complete len:241 (-),score=89.77 GABV01000851.1:56-778(-)
MSIGDLLRNRDAAAASSALDWVQKSRKISADKIEEERRLAQEKAKQLQEMEEEEEEEANNISAAGLRIAHGAEQLQSDGPVILTLADNPILNEKGEYNASEDKLQSVDIVEAERDARARRRRAGKPDYDPFEESNRLLPQYDEEAREKAISDRSITIGADGTISAAEAARQASARVALSSDRPSLREYATAEDLQATRQTVSLDTETKFQSEYFSKEEMSSFKKKKKRKKKEQKVPKKPK